MRGRGKGDKRRSRTSGTRWAGCLPLPPTPSLLSQEIQEYERRPAPLTCLQMKTSCNRDDSCLYFTELFLFTYHVPSSNTERGARLEIYTIQFEMNASHTGHKALPGLPQSTPRFRCSNKEEEEVRSGKCIDLKKNFNEERQKGERERKKAKKQNRQRNRQCGAQAAGAY